MVTGQFREGQNLNFAVPGEYVLRLKDKVNTKPFWQWAEKEVRNKRLEDLGTELNNNQHQVARELERLRQLIEFKRNQLNRQKENEKRNLERKRKKLEYEYEALLNARLKLQAKLITIRQEQKELEASFPFEETDQKPTQILSIPDGIAKLFMRYYLNKVIPVSNGNGSNEVCPKCGAFMIAAEGCFSCSCGYSKCS